MSEELLRYRSEFPILDRTTYLISNSLGAMPRGVEDAHHHYTDLSFSPHFYNSDKELTKAVETVEEILSEMKVGAR